MKESTENQCKAVLHVFKITLIVLGIGLFASCDQLVDKSRQDGLGALEMDPPNIIFIMSDDHAYQAVSAYGHGLNKTPHIDRLAREGAIFNLSLIHI